MTTYTVIYEIDDDGWWVADVVGLRGAHTQGRTLASTAERIREVISLLTDEDEDAIRLADEVHLPPAVANAVSRAKTAREQAHQAEQQALKESQAAARALVHDASRSVRDAARIMGVSHGRIHQLATAPPSKSPHSHSAEPPARKR